MIYLERYASLLLGLAWVCSTFPISQWTPRLIASSRTSHWSLEPLSGTQVPSAVPWRRKVWECKHQSTREEGCLRPVDDVCPSHFVAHPIN